MAFESRILCADVSRYYNKEFCNCFLFFSFSFFFLARSVDTLFIIRTILRIVGQIFHSTSILDPIILQMYIKNNGNDLPLRMPRTKPHGIVVERLFTFLFFSYHQPNSNRLLNLSIRVCKDY